MSPQANDAGRGIRDQIARYSGSFTAIVVLIVVALLVGGYILSQERLTLPSWFPVLGHEHFLVKADFQTGQALAPGQGQAVTIAGAKIGEVESVELRHGIAVVSMELTPKYARYIHRDATLLVRPKTQLKDETIEVDTGSASAGRVRSGYTFSLAQTAPDVNFEQFLSSLDAETRTYLQELLAGAGIALKGNGRELAADFTRFDPLARDLQEISSELQHREVYIRRSIHNFQLLMSALGNTDGQLSEAISASNRVFATFSKEQAAVQRTLRLLPSALHKTKRGLAALATAARVVGPTLNKLHRFAVSLKPAQQANRRLFKATTPVIEKQIGPFTREVLPILRQLTPATKSFNKALPAFTSSFGVLNELFNELAYNPGGNVGSFLFYADWASHDFNSALSTADANGPLGRTLLYFNCNIATILSGLTEVNPNVRLLVGLLKPPTEKDCIAQKIQFSATAATARATTAHAARAATAHAARAATAHAARAATAHAARHTAHAARHATSRAAAHAAAGKRGAR